MRFVKDDGGRRACGFKWTSGDCVARSISILTERPYHKVYSELAWLNVMMPKTKGRATVGLHTAGRGIYTKSALFKRYMVEQGFVWTPTMGIGTGVLARLREEDLPNGRLAVVVARHLTAVIDGVIYDTHDPGLRCVYGYWKLDTKLALASKR
jgi:hypothetical protein